MSETICDGQGDWQGHTLQFAPILQVLVLALQTDLDMILLICLRFNFATTLSKVIISTVSLKEENQGLNSLILFWKLEKMSHIIDLMQMNRSMLICRFHMLMMVQVVQCFH